MKPAPESPSTPVPKRKGVAADDGAAAMQAEAERDRAVTALLQHLKAKAAIKRESHMPATLAQPRTLGAALRQEFALLPDDHPKSLRGLARRLINEAAEAANPLSAIKEIANRLDAEDAEHGGPQPITRIERIIVHPENSDR